MACALSHIQVWNKYKDTDVPVLILEDDSVIHPQFRQIVNDSIADLTRFDPEWHILWLSGYTPGNRTRVCSSSGRFIYRMDPPEHIGQGTVGYILSPLGIAYFLEKLEINGCGHASDYFLLEHLDVHHAYGLYKPLLDYKYNLFASTI